MQRLSAARSVARTTVKVVASAVQVLLLVRIVVLFFAPSASDPIVNALLNVTQPLVDPFRDAVRASLEDVASGTILDAHAMAALIGYTILELALVWALGWHRTRLEPLPPSPRGLSAPDQADQLRPTDPG